jgi:PAS domain S-box-containing protein
VEKRTIEYQIANRELQREIKDHKKAETQKKAAVEALQESEKMYRALVESASDMVYRTNVDGYFTFINASAVRITGYDEKETIGKHYSVFIHPDQRESAVKFFNHQFDTMLQNTYSEYPIVTKDGRDVWLGQNTQLIVENGEVAGFQAVSRDITENKMMEKEQKVS